MWMRVWRTLAYATLLAASLLVLERDPAAAPTQSSDTPADHRWGAAEVAQLAMEGQWSAIARLPVDGSAVDLLRAHALLLTRPAEAYCAFQVADTANWGHWTTDFATLHPDSAVARYLFADAKARSGDLTGAVESFTAAIALDPRFALAYNARGVASAVLGDQDRALVDFLAAQALMPAWSEPPINRAWQDIARRQGLDGSLKLFDRALALAPGSLVARAGRAYVLVLRNRDQPLVRKEIRELGRDADGCFVGNLTEDLIALARWAGEQDGKGLQAKNETPGTSVTRDLNALQKGNIAAPLINRLAVASAQNPAQAVRINAALTHFSETRPTLGAQIGMAINAGTTRTSPTGIPGILLSTVSGLTLRAGAPEFGLTLNAVSLGQNLAARMATENLGFKSMQNALKPAQIQLGGVDTTLAERYFERGDYALLPHYALGYRKGNK